MTEEMEGMNKQMLYVLECEAERRGYFAGFEKGLEAMDVFEAGECSDITKECIQTCFNEWQKTLNKK